MKRYFTQRGQAMIPIDVHYRTTTNNIDQIGKFNPIFHTQEEGEKYFKNEKQGENKLL